MSFLWPAPVKRERKRYLDDSSTPVPRSTFYRWKKNKGPGGKSSAKKLLEYNQKPDFDTDYAEGNF